MDVQIKDSFTGEFLQVDPSYNAARASLRPLEYQDKNGVGGGHYAITAITGTLAAGIAANAQIFQVRWADATKKFVLLKLTAHGATGTAFTTLFGADAELVIGHGSTANGSGGAAVAPTGNSNQMRRSMGATAFATSGEIRVATTAALTAATGQTLETAGIGWDRVAPFLISTHNPKVNLFDQRDAGGHPLILEAGDTLVVRTPNPGATGTWSVGFEMIWAEVVAY